MAYLEDQMTPEEHREALIAYLLSCVEREDWHAVSDAANDLRVLEAEIKFNAPR